MKILFTVEFYEPSKGGAQEVVKQLAERLVRLGHSVTVATRFLPNRQFNVLNGVVIKSFHISGNIVRGMSGQEQELKKYQAFLLGNFDIIINYAAQVWTTDLAFEMLSEIKARKILIPCGYSGLKNKKYATYFRELPKFLEQYDSLVYTSPHYQDAVFGQNNGFSDKAVIIPNGASQEEFLSVAKKDVREVLGIKTRYLAICVSNHYKAKGHRFIIEAFKKMNRSDVTLLIIGSIPAFGVRKVLHSLFGCFPGCLLESLAHKNIRLLPGGDRELTISAYQEADLFLFGSKVECAPLVMYESFASRTLFVTRNVGNVADHTEVIKIVCSEDEMAHVANTLLDSRLERDAITTAAFNLWKNHHTWDTIVEQYQKLFSSLFSNRA